MNTQPYRLICGEALQELKKLPAQSCAALISDPPYGLTDLSWDKAIDLTAFWQEAYRVCKPHAIFALFSQQPFTTDLINSNRRAFRYELIWHKPNAVGWLSANRRPLRAHENILVFCRRFAGSTYHPQKVSGYKPYRTVFKGVARHYGKQRSPGFISQSNTGERYPRSVLLFSNRNTPSLHPTQKPLPLVEWLVQSYSEENDVVLDPFMGSGTTGVACLKYDRRFIGIEIEPESFETAQGRLAIERADERTTLESERTSLANFEESNPLR